jgi:hypothetical protein
MNQIFKHAIILSVFLMSALASAQQYAQVSLSESLKYHRKLIQALTVGIPHPQDLSSIVYNIDLKGRLVPYANKGMGVSRGDLIHGDLGISSVSSDMAKAVVFAGFYRPEVIGGLNSGYVSYKAAVDLSKPSSIEKEISSQGFRLAYNLNGIGVVQALSQLILTVGSTGQVQQVQFVMTSVRGVSATKYSIYPPFYSNNKTKAPAGFRMSDGFFH